MLDISQQTANSENCRKQAVISVSKAYRNSTCSNCNYLPEISHRNSTCSFGTDTVNKLKARNGRDGETGRSEGTEGRTNAGHGVAGLHLEGKHRFWRSGFRGGSQVAVASVCEHQERWPTRPSPTLFPSCSLESQVFDLAEDNPEEELVLVLGRLEKLMSEGHKIASDIRTNLRMMVTGGDGTVGWLLGIVSDLKLESPLPTATVPLGTGNNLPYSFGWGKKNPSTSVEAVRKLLLKVAHATPLLVDSWHVIMKMALSEQDKSLEPVKVPHSLHSFKRVSPKDPLHQEGRLTFRGGFWNYFSIGMDAQVAYEFHSRREKEPQKFKNQFRNQTRYWWLTCRQGWFCASCIHPSSRNIPQLAKIKIAKHAGEWEELKVLSSIRSIVVLNLPSFSGGLNPWGKPGDKQSKERGLTPPFVNDGLLEIVGFRDACHGMVLFSPNGHGVRLAQAHKVKIEFHSGAANHTYLRMDGEPWFQPLTSGHKKTVLEISHLGQALLLVTPDCIAKPASNLPPGVTGHSEQTGSTIPAGEGEGGVGSLSATAFGKSSSFSDSDDSPKRKFGAASTFKGMIQ